MSTGRSYEGTGQTPVSGGVARPSERVYGTDCGLRTADAAGAAMPGERIYGADVGQKASTGYHQDAKERASRGFQDMQSEETQRLDESRFEPSKGHNEANAESPSITERIRDQASHIFHSAKEYASGAVDTVKHKAGEAKDAVRDKFSSGNQHENEHTDDSSTTFVDQSRYEAGKENKMPQTESKTVGDRLHGQATDLYDSARDTFQRQWDSGSQRTDTTGMSNTKDTIGSHRADTAGMQQPSSFGTQHTKDTTGSQRTDTLGMQQPRSVGTQQLTKDTGLHQTNNFGESRFDTGDRSGDSNRDSKSVTEKVRDKASDMYHSAKDTAQEKWAESKDYMSGNTDKDSTHPTGKLHDTTYRGAGVGTCETTAKTGRNQEQLRGSGTAMHDSSNLHDSSNMHDSAFKIGGHRDSNKDKLAHESGLKRTDNVMLGGQTKAEETRGG